jgi:hypothetical protein
VKAATPEQARQMQEVREQTLVQRRLNGGRLNLSELKEVRHVIGDEQFKRAVELLGVTDPDPAVDAPDGSPPATLGRAKYLKPLEEYEEIFETKKRGIKKWIARGKAAIREKIQGASLPPLDEPEKMKDWWARHMSQRCPDKILRLALEAQTQGATAGAAGNRSIDVKSFDLEEDDVTKQARGFLAAAAHNLTQAYTGGQDADIERGSRRWDKAMDSFKKAEATARAAAKQRGDLISRPELFSEMSTLLETVRNVQNTMSRRIRARLGELPPELDARLDAVIEAERRSELSILRRLKFFRSTDEVVLELDTAAVPA